MEKALCIGCSKPMDQKGQHVTCCITTCGHLYGWSCIKGCETTDGMYKCGLCHKHFEEKNIRILRVSLERASSDDLQESIDSLDLYVAELEQKIKKIKLDTTMESRKQFEISLANHVEEMKKVHSERETYLQNLSRLNIETEAVLTELDALVVEITTMLKELELSEDLVVGARATDADFDITHLRNILLLRIKQKRELSNAINAAHMSPAVGKGLEERISRALTIIGEARKKNCNVSRELVAYALGYPTV